jgi:hypothetical protein
MDIYRSRSSDRGNNRLAGNEEKKRWFVGAKPNAAEHAGRLNF